MISKELLDILQCPETHRSLSEADDDLVRRLNGAIDRGHLKNQGGQAVSRTLTGALLREDGQVVYPIIDEIPVLLTDEAIALDQFSD